MCVDDYAFRHYSAQRERICRRFIFKSQSSSDRIFLVNISQFEIYGDLCLCEILLHLNKKGLSIKDNSFYFSNLNISVEAGDRCLVPFDVMKEKDITVQMHKIEENHDYEGRLPDNILSDEMQGEEDSFSLQKMNEMQNQSSEQKLSYSSKQKNKKKVNLAKTKEPEKTVQQAIYKTKHWRYLHEKANLSLKNAALVVGTSKKTLDDFFLVIRVGELHGYNFKINLQQKIGHLRAYIKSQSLKIKGRLSKMVECFKFVEDPPIDNVLPVKSWQKVDEISEEIENGLNFTPNFNGYCSLEKPN